MAVDDLCYPNRFEGSFSSFSALRMMRRENVAGAQLSTVEISLNGVNRSCYEALVESFAESAESSSFKVAGG